MTGLQCHLIAYLVWFVPTVHNKHIKQSNSWAVVNISKSSDTVIILITKAAQGCRNWSLPAFKNPLHHGTMLSFLLFCFFLHSFPYIHKFTSYPHLFPLYSPGQLTNFSHFRWDGCDHVTSLLKLKLTWHLSSVTGESNLTCELLPYSRNSKLQFNKSSLLASE